VDGKKAMAEGGKRGGETTQARKRGEEVAGPRTQGYDDNKRGREKILSQRRGDVVSPVSGRTNPTKEKYASVLAAKALGIGHTTVDRAKRVQRDAPELIPKIRSGELTAALFPVEREAAKERHREGSARGGKGVGKLPTPSKKVQARDKVARYTGVSGSQTTFPKVSGR